MGRRSRRGLTGSQVRFLAAGRQLKFHYSKDRQITQNQVKALKKLPRHKLWKLRIILRIRNYTTKILDELAQLDIDRMKPKGKNAKK